MACTIYGQETVEFTLSITDTHSAIVHTTTDWDIEDILLDLTDNTQVITDVLYTVKPTHQFQSSGVKTITAITDFDDGWGNVYQHETLLDVEPIPYDPPTMDFSWTPLNPTVVDMVTFSQDHNDTRDLTNTKGRIDEVRVDFHNDGFDVVDINGDGVATNDIIGDTDQFYNQFVSKETGIPITVEATYWDGWEHQLVDITKSLDMSNIPPVADYNTAQDGICVPSYVWTATSTDTDDDDTLLAHSWELFLEQGVDWVLLDSGMGTTFTYPFQFEGTYKVSLTSADVDGSTGVKEDVFLVGFDACSAGGGSCSGTIKIQNNAWQLIAIPRNVGNVKEYFVDRLATSYGVAPESLIDICNTYIGGEGRFRSYIPGVTNAATSNNFPLIYDDGVNREITGFWVKTFDFTAATGHDALLFSWEL